MFLAPLRRRLAAEGGRRFAALIQRPWNVRGRSHWVPDVIGRVPEQERMSTHAEVEDRDPRIVVAYVRVSKNPGRGS
jgi:hypothetical protein